MVSDFELNQSMYSRMYDLEEQIATLKGDLNRWKGSFQELGRINARIQDELSKVKERNELLEDENDRLRIVNEELNRYNRFEAIEVQVEN
jgi:lipocalin